MLAGLDLRFIRNLSKFLNSDLCQLDITNFNFHWYINKKI